MQLIRLTYTRQKDPTQFVTVLGEPAAIRDLYWQLTQNYSAIDGTAIGKVTVTDMNGKDCTDKIMHSPFSIPTPSTTIT
jgi:C-terminal processing protease CtpA/Prc